MAPRYVRERRDEFVRPGRTAIYGGAVDDGFGVRPAPIVATAPALRLRQDVVETIGEAA